MGLLSAIGGLFQSDEDRAAGNLNALQRFGIALDQGTTQKNTPSAILEWQAFNNLSPQDQQRYLTLKRAQPLLNQGNQYSTYDPVSGQVAPIAPINPKVAEMPEFQADVATARQDAENQSNLKYASPIASEKERGKAQGEAQGTQEKKAIQAPAIIDLLDRAEKLLPNATSGTIERVGRDAAGAMGIATEGSDADSSLDVIAAGLIQNVPRMEGPQSDADRRLYEKAAGDLANPNKPISNRQAAIDTIRGLQEKYAGKAAAPTPSASPSAAPQGGITKEQALQELKRRGVIK